jgi:AhpD family alkylhydroperoxidase
MTRITSIDPTTAHGRTKELLDATKAQLGRIPNLYGSMAQSPAALDGYLAFRSALGKGVLSTPMRERIALLTAAINDCGYCVSAHTFRGAKVGLSASDLAAT